MTRSLSLSIAAVLLAAPLASRAQETKAPAAEPAPVPATPAPPTVQVYGTLNVNTQWTRTFNGVTAAGVPTKANDVSPRLAISTDSTNIGVRGGMKVIDWMQVDYQCETQAQVNGFDLRGLCGRNSKLGVSGVFGSAFMGNWDTPFKSVWYGTKADDPFGNTDVFNATNLMGSPGFGYRSSNWINDTTVNGAAGAQAGAVIPAPANTVAGFDIRANQSLSYWTPKYSGLQAKFMYGVNEFKNQTGSVSPKLWSASLIYDNGPISIVGAFEDHEDSFGLVAINPAGTGGAGSNFGAVKGNTAVAHSEDRAYRIGAGYQLPTDTIIAGAFERLQYLQGAGVVGSIAEYSRYAWQVAVTQNFGKHQLRFRYNKAEDGDCKIVGGGACSTVGYGAVNYTAGYAYLFTKTAQVYLTYVDIRNGNKGQYTFNTGGAPTVYRAPGTTKGNDPQAVALGLRYAF
jgi:hypothetical protein